MKLKELMRERIRAKNQSLETFKTYWHWCEEYMRWLKKRNGSWTHPKDAWVPEVTQYLSDLANIRHLSGTSQNVALQALCYLYREVIGNPLQGVDAIRAKRPTTVPDVLSVEQVRALLEQLQGVYLLATQLMYGSGLRISEVANLRLKDFNFDRGQIHVHAAKGNKSRLASFPKCMHANVNRQIESVKLIHREDQTQNPNGVSMPNALRTKSPKASLKLGWYYLFPSDRLSRGDDGILCRHHRDKDAIGKEIRAAAERAGILQSVTCHKLRHAYATHSNEQGVDIRTLQVLLGHSDSKTTEIYVHVNKDRATAAVSPLQQIEAEPKSELTEIKDMLAKLLADPSLGRRKDEPPRTLRISG